MARRVFTTDAILDAAREVVVQRGPRAATVEAIAAAAGAPVGSIYHRFRSIDELLARLWLRAVTRTQERALAVAVDPRRPLDAAIAIALAMYDHCLAEPQDTLLLDVLSHAALLDRDVGDLQSELETANVRIEELMAGLARSLFGRADRRGRDLVLLALVDMPHGFARRELSSRRAAPARRERLPAAVAAVLAGGDGAAVGDGA